MSSNDAKAIERQQLHHQREEFKEGLRALLMTPLMDPNHERFSAVRRHADELREWFSREAGWPLHVERDGARLLKRPANLADSTRGFKDFSRQRYTLLCLACAVLERSDAQITLKVLGERLLQLANDPALESRDFSFTLGSHHERRDLVIVCKALLGISVLHRLAGDEDAYLHATGTDADALYDVNRRALAGLLASVRGPSTWPTNEAPATLEERLHSLVDEFVPDSEEGRRTALRHQIARRLLDDPVLYLDELSPEGKAYFLNQRGVLAARLAEATGLHPEQRAEGVAMVDEEGELTDIAMPAEGTDAHATLLVAEHLCRAVRDRAFASPDRLTGHSQADLAAFIAHAREQFGRYWRRSAREPGAEQELAEIAIQRLKLLHLVRIEGGLVYPLPALARFALGNADIKTAGPAPVAATSSGSLEAPTS